MVMEYAQGGNLKDLIRDRLQAQKPFSEEEAATIMRNILLGIQYLHNNGIVHQHLRLSKLIHFIDLVHRSYSLHVQRRSK